MHQAALFDNASTLTEKGRPFTLQLLKWVGNKQRFAHEIISCFPERFGTYYEPFLGSGAVLGTLAPRKAIASDAIEPLIEIWSALRSDPSEVLKWYRDRWRRFQKKRQEAYEKIKASYNSRPNGADLLFLSRSCYGGVVRFRKDGYMSTPCGPHNPISPESMEKRIAVWRERVSGTEFFYTDFEEMVDRAGQGDLVYCDPPYLHTQAILYGAQTFSLERLFETIARAKRRGAYVALSIDGKKKSGAQDCHIPIPDGLFERSVAVNCGRSMLRRFQMGGETLESEVVSDRLFLTWTQ